MQQLLYTNYYKSCILFPAPNVIIRLEEQSLLQICSSNRGVHITHDVDHAQILWYIIYKCYVVLKTSVSALDTGSNFWSVYIIWRTCVLSLPWVHIHQMTATL